MSGSSFVQSNSLHNSAEHGRTRVLIVDDSVVIRQLLTRMLGSDPKIEVVGSARNGSDALSKISQLRPHLITLDIEMPEMNGLEALALIKHQFPEVRVIMCSRLTERGAAATMEALLKGADDYVTKDNSSQMSAHCFDMLRVNLLAKVNQLVPSSSRVLPPPRALLSACATDKLFLRNHRTFANRKAIQIVAIGVSTGGPAALASIAAQIPAGFPVPIVIVQHMPPFFTQLLAERLTKLGPTRVVEAQAGMALEAGMAYIAPGNYHMSLIRKNGTVEVTLDQKEHENSCRPAVDVLFRSVAELYGPACLAVVLTGMGQDGLRGVRTLKSSGAKILVQDRESSVVWGMPGAVAEAQLADMVLPLTEIVPAITRQL